MVELCTQQFFSKQRCVRFLSCSLYDCRAKQDSILQPFPSYQFPSFVSVDWKMSSKISFLSSAFVLNTSHQPIPAHHFMNTNVENYSIMFCLAQLPLQYYSLPFVDLSKSKFGRKKICDRDGSRLVASYSPFHIFFQYPTVFGTHSYFSH